MTVGIVVDASIALKWFVIEDGSRTAVSFLSRGFTRSAPDLLVAEVANAAWRGHKRGLIRDLQFASIVQHLPPLIDELVPCGSLVERACRIAATLDHPVYDAFYVALAERLSVPLVTADRRLIGKLRTSPWSALVMDLDRDVTSHDTP